MSLRDVVDAWVCMRDMIEKDDVKAFLNKNENTTETLFFRLCDMVPQIIGEMEKELKNGSKVVPIPDAWERAVEKAQSKAPEPAPPSDITYEQFAQLFEDNDRPVTDSFRVWFEKDFGGWDKTTADDRVAVWLKAQEYFSRPKKPRTSGNWKERNDRKERVITKCQECGGTETKIYTSQSANNKGRDYVGCANDRKWFRWAD